MSSNKRPPDEPVSTAVDERLESWKEIATYLRRDISTVQRWEKREGLPVLRHLHEKLSTVYAYKSALDSWRDNRQSRLGQRRKQARQRTYQRTAAVAGVILLVAVAVGA